MPNIPEANIAEIIRLLNQPGPDVPNISNEAIEEIVRLLNARIENRLPTTTVRRIKTLLGYEHDAEPDTHAVRSDMSTTGRMS